jgi:hypothetical protein
MASCWIYPIWKEQRSFANDGAEACHCNLGRYTTNYMILKLERRIHINETTILSISQTPPLQRCCASVERMRLKGKVRGKQVAHLRIQIPNMHPTTAALPHSYTVCTPNQLTNQPNPKTKQNNPGTPICPKSRKPPSASASGEGGFTIGNPLERSIDALGLFVPSCCLAPWRIANSRFVI